MNEGINIQNDGEIENALKEFELKAQADAEKRARQNLNEKKPSKMVDLVIRHSHGYIKEQKQAEYVLLAFVVFAIGLSAFLLFYDGDDYGLTVIPEGTRIVYPPNAPPRLETY